MHGLGLTDMYVCKVFVVTPVQMCSQDNPSLTTCDVSIIGQQMRTRNYSSLLLSSIPLEAVLALLSRRSRRWLVIRLVKVQGMLHQDRRVGDWEVPC